MNGMCIVALHRRYTRALCWQSRIILLLLAAGVLLLWV